MCKHISLYICVYVYRHTYTHTYTIHTYTYDTHTTHIYIYIHVYNYMVNTLLILHCTMFYCIIIYYYIKEVLAHSGW